MNHLTAAELRDVYDENGGDATRIAAALGIDKIELAERVTLPPSSGYRRRRQPPADLGKDYFRQHIVSARHTDHSTWPSEDEVKIEEARAKYEAGTHDICQGRDRNWFVLYCVPLQTRVGARKFFRLDL